MTRPLLVADLFCGAGGTSTGAQLAAEALGRPMVLTCANHWPTAIETHRRNHPAARHHCQDIAAVRPGAAVPEGYLDLLMASPTCTHHSRARGGKPTSDQQRADPWHIVTWLTELRVKRLLIENVPEFMEWGPVNLRTGRPMASRRGEYFREWCATLKRLGFKVEHRIINCADHGDATTRQRFFLQARSDGKPIVWPQPTHSRTGTSDMFGAGSARWRPAREIIDWSRPGRSIFNRKKPLSPKTLQRILAGALKLRWPEPYIVVLRNHMAAQGIDQPLPTITAGGTHIGLATPFLMPQRSDHLPTRSAEDSLPTITTVSRIGLVQPCILPQPSAGRLRPVDEPIAAIATAGAHALVAPYYGGGSGETCKPVDVPLDTVTTKARFGLVVPVTHGGGPNRSHDVNAPLPTLTTARGGELALASPTLIVMNGRSDAAPIELPAPTITGTAHLAVAEPGPEYDILFRMLEPHELAAAMSFDALGPYDFAGTKADVIKQIGNAVPVRTARALIAAMLHDLAPAHQTHPDDLMRVDAAGIAA